MSGSNRVFIAAVAGLALSYPVYQAARAQGAAPENQSKATHQPSLASNTAIEKNLNRIASAMEANQADPNAAAEEDRAKRDLKAQQDMARYALWMVFATPMTVVLTGVGVLLIWRTLIHTRRASKYADVAARQARRAAISSDRMADEAQTATAAAIAAAAAGQEANKIANASSEQQLRAFMRVRATTVPAPEHLTSSFAKVEVINYGQTPAKKIQIYRHGFFGAIPIAQWSCYRKPVA